jgi:Dictyostelium (slime mold) repeat
MGPPTTPRAFVRLGLALLALALALGSSCRGCGGGALVAVGGDFTVAPASLDFGRALEGTHVRRTVTVTSASRLRLEVPVATAEPFAAPGPLELPAAGETTLEVTFDAGSADAVGVLHLGPEDGGVDVSLRGVGVAPLDCTPSGPCVVSTFEVETGACVESPAAEGADCDPLDLCLERGQCHAGACLGTPRSCDDNDVCTLDACSSAVGCVHTPRLCPTPANPCHVATCDPTRGCGEANAPELTACGPADCNTFSVCLVGLCVTGPTPEGVSCGVAVACLPLGTCQTVGSSRQCVVPDAGDWQPDWAAEVPVEPSGETPVLLASGSTLFFEACGAAFAPDAGAADAGVADAGATDAGATDAGGVDAGAADAGAADAGGVDAGAADAGVGTWCGLVSYTGTGFLRFATPFADGLPRRLVHVAPRGVLLEGAAGLSYHSAAGGAVLESIPVAPPQDGVASAPDGTVLLLGADGGLYAWPADAGAGRLTDTVATVLSLDLVGRAFLWAPVEGTLARVELLEDGGVALALLALDAGAPVLTAAGTRAVAGALAVVGPDDAGALQAVALDLDGGQGDPVRGGLLQTTSTAALFALRCPTPAVACAEAEAALWLSSFELDTGARAWDVQVSPADPRSRLVLATLLDVQPPQVAVAAVTVTGFDGGVRSGVQVFSGGQRSLACLFPPGSTDLLDAVVTDQALVVLARRPDGGVGLESYGLGVLPVHRTDWAAPFGEGGARRAR